MSKKISELDPVDSVNDDDAFTFARPPFTPSDNYRVTLPNMLNRPAGPGQAFGAGGGTLSFDDAGFPILDIPANQGFQVRFDGAEVLRYNGSAWFLVGGFHVDTGNPALRFDIDIGSPQASLLCDGESAQVSYVPGEDSDWDGSPTIMSDALDELAARVRALGG